MKSIAITGGIAAGKSTVAKMFDELGAQIIDADLIAHDCYSPGTPLHQEILEQFGKHLKNPDDTINRKELGAIVFKTPEAKSWLENRTHGATRKIIAEMVSQYSKTNIPLVLVEAALHVETGFYRDFDGLIVVHVDAETQLQRLIHRDQMAPSLAEAIIANQMPLEEKRGHAHWVIDNSGTLAETQQQVTNLFNELVQD